MKYLAIADGVAGLFKKKVTVLLKELHNEKLLGNFKIDEKLIPAVFNRPTILSIGGKEWRIIEVNELREPSYFMSRKILLTVSEVADFNNEERFSVPTMAIPDPAISIYSEDNAKLLSILKEDWRQMEFFSITIKDLVREEINAIEKTLLPENSPSPLLGFLQIHQRLLVSDHWLEIPFEKFCAILKIKDSGRVIMNTGFVIDSFFIQTENNTFYGICKNGTILTLCLHDFESVEEELMKVMEQFGLLMVDWCNAKMLYFDPADVQEISNIPDGGFELT